MVPLDLGAELGIDAGAEEPADQGPVEEDLGSGSTPGDRSFDAGIPDARAAVDQGATPDAAIIDAGTGLDDDPAAGLSAHEREEAAKDAIFEARRALADGDVEAATRALARARRLDPGNSDIDELSAQL